MFFNTDAANAYYLRGTEYDKRPESDQQQQQAGPTDRRGNPAAGAGAGRRPARPASADVVTSRTQYYIDALQRGRASRSGEGATAPTTPGGPGRLPRCNPNGCSANHSHTSRDVSGDFPTCTAQPASGGGGGGRGSRPPSTPDYRGESSWGNGLSLRTRGIDSGGGSPAPVAPHSSNTAAAAATAPLLPPPHPRRAAPQPHLSTAVAALGPRSPFVNGLQGTPSPLRAGPAVSGVGGGASWQDWMAGLRAVNEPSPPMASAPSEWAVEVVLTTLLDDPRESRHHHLGPRLGESVAVTLSAQADLLLVASLRVQPPHSLAAALAMVPALPQPSSAVGSAEEQRRDVYAAVVVQLRKAVASALSLAYVPRDFFYHDPDFRQYVRLTPETVALAKDGTFRVVVVSATGSLPRTLLLQQQQQQALGSGGGGNSPTAITTATTPHHHQYQQQQQQQYAAVAAPAADHSTAQQHREPPAPLLSEPARAPLHHHSQQQQQQQPDSGVSPRPPGFDRPASLVRPFSAPAAAVRRPLSPSVVPYYQHIQGTGPGRSSLPLAPTPTSASTPLVMRSSVPDMQRQWREALRRSRSRSASAGAGGGGGAVRSPSAPSSGVQSPSYWDAVLSAAAATQAEHHGGGGDEEFDAAVTAAVHHRLPLGVSHDLLELPVPLRPVPPPGPSPMRVGDEEEGGVDGVSTPTPTASLGGGRFYRRAFRVNELYNPADHFYFEDANAPPTAAAAPAPVPVPVPAPAPAMAASASSKPPPPPPVREEIEVEDGEQANQGDGSYSRDGHRSEGDHHSCTHDDDRYDRALVETAGYEVGEEDDEEEALRSAAAGTEDTEASAELLFGRTDNSHDVGRETHLGEDAAVAVPRPFTPDVCAGSPVLPEDLAAAVVPGMLLVSQATSEPTAIDGTEEEEPTEVLLLPRTVYGLQGSVPGLGWEEILAAAPALVSSYARLDIHALYSKDGTKAAGTQCCDDGGDGDGVGVMSNLRFSLGSLILSFDYTHASAAGSDDDDEDEEMAARCRAYTFPHLRILHDTYNIMRRMAPSPPAAVAAAVTDDGGVSSEAVLAPVVRERQADATGAGEEEAQEPVPEKVGPERAVAAHEHHHHHEQQEGVEEGMSPTEHATGTTVEDSWGELAAPEEEASGHREDQEEKVGEEADNDPLEYYQADVSHASAAECGSPSEVDLGASTPSLREVPAAQTMSEPAAQGDHGEEEEDSPAKEADPWAEMSDSVDAPPLSAREESEAAATDAATPPPAADADPWRVLGEPDEDGAAPAAASAIEDAYPAAEEPPAELAGAEGDAPARLPTEIPLPPRRPSDFPITEPQLEVIAESSLRAPCDTGVTTPVLAPLVGHLTEEEEEDGVGEVESVEVVDGEAVRVVQAESPHSPSQMESSQQYVSTSVGLPTYQQSYVLPIPSGGGGGGPAGSQLEQSWGAYSTPVAAMPNADDGQCIEVIQTDNPLGEDNGNQSHNDETREEELDDGKSPMSLPRGEEEVVEGDHQQQDHSLTAPFSEDSAEGYMRPSRSHSSDSASATIGGEAQETMAMVASPPASPGPGTEAGGRVPEESPLLSGVHPTGEEGEGGGVHSFSYPTASPPNLAVTASLPLNEPEEEVEGMAEEEEEDQWRELGDEEPSPPVANGASPPSTPPASSADDPAPRLLAAVIVPPAPPEAMTATCDAAALPSFAVDHYPADADVREPRQRSEDYTREGDARTEPPARLSVSLTADAATAPPAPAEDDAAQVLRAEVRGSPTPMALAAEALTAEEEGEAAVAAVAPGRSSLPQYALEYPTEVPGNTAEPPGPSAEEEEEHKTPLGAATAAFNNLAVTSTTTSTATTSSESLLHGTTGTASSSSSRLLAAFPQHDERPPDDNDNEDAPPRPRLPPPPPLLAAVHVTTVPARDAVTAAADSSGAHRRSLQKLGFLGNSWAFILVNFFDELDAIFKQEVADALALGPSCVEEVRYTQGSLMVDFFVLAPASLADADVKDLLVEHPYNTLWELYGAKRKEHKRVTRRRESEAARSSPFTGMDRVPLHEM